MKLRDYKPNFEKILLYATNYERTYKKVLGVGSKGDFAKFYDANVLTITDNYNLQTTTIFIIDDPKFKGQIIRGKGW